MATHLLHDSAPVRSGDLLEWKVYSTPEQIEEIAHAWDELLAVSPCNRTFSSREWYMASCARLSSWNPYVVTVFRGGKALCILALVIDSEDKTVKFAHHCDYNDVVTRTTDPELIADLLSYALANAKGCHRMVLSRLRPDSHCAQAVPLLRACSEFECDWREIDRYGRACLPESFNGYLNSRSKAFLDEATSALDPRTEAHVCKVARKTMANRTALVIAHRLSTIQAMDKIVVMHEGTIRESGDHKTLLAQRGLYWMLYQ